MRAIFVNENIFCKKVKYSSKKFADNDIERIHAKNKKTKQYRSKEPIRSYFCKKCGGWHITSQPPYIDFRLKENEYPTEAKFVLENLNL